MKSFQGALSAGAFVATVEWSFHRQEAGEIIDQATELSGHFDGLLLAEMPVGETGISATAIAALLRRKGIDATPVLNCRDRNRIALKSELLGLKALGVTSVLLMRGEAVPINEIPALQVFDVDVPELIAMAHETEETRLLIGTEADVPADHSSWTSSSLRERATAGARFLRLRPCYDMDLLRAHMARLVEEKLTWSYSVIPSFNPGEHGIDACAEMIRNVKSIPGVSGINLVCQDRPDDAVATLRAAGIETHS